MNKIKRKENVVYNGVFMSVEPLLHIWHNQEHLNFVDISRKAGIKLYEAHNIYKDEEEQIKKAEALITNPARVYWHQAMKAFLTWDEYRKIEDFILKEVGLKYTDDGKICPIKKNGKRWTIKINTEVINNEIYEFGYFIARMKASLSDAVSIKYY